MYAALRPVALPLAVTLSIQIAVTLALYSAPVLAPVAAPALGFSPSAIGYFIAIAYLGSMLGGVAGGALIPRFGPLRMSQAGLASCLLGMAVGGAASQFAGAAGALLAVSALLLGFGYGPTTPASSTILIRSAPPTLLSLTFSIKQTGVPIGGAIAGLSVPWLVNTVGWQWAALTIGLVSLALAMALQPLRGGLDFPLHAPSRLSLPTLYAPIRLVITEKPLARMALTSFTYGGLQLTLITYLVSFLIEAFSAAFVFAGALLAASQVAGAVGRITWGGLADRLNKPLAVLGALGIGMGLCALVTLAASPGWPAWALFTFAILFGATAVGWNGVYFASVARLAPPGRASEATGGCLFFSFFGAVVAPPLFHAIVHLTASYSVAYAIFGIPALVLGLWLLRSKPS